MQLANSKSCRLKHSEEQLDKPYTVPPFTNTAVKATGAVLLPSNSSFRRRHLPEVLAERRRGRWGIADLTTLSCGGHVP